MTTPDDIAHQRLHNQHIAQPTFNTPAEVVGWLGAIQAQDYLGALWTIGLRMNQATEAAIEQAVADRTIIRTWPMRGTLHFVAPEDARWMLNLLTPPVIARTAPRHRQLELDQAVFARSKGLFVKALQGGKQLTREDMYAVLERGKISSVGQRGYHILVQLAQEGLICWGPRSDKQQTFVLLDEWIPQSCQLDRDEALAAVATRYFTGHGPATLPDFMWWTGLKAADARTALDLAAGQLAQASVDGKSYWMAQDTPALHNPAPSVYLLPGFDEYMLGYTDRSAALAPQDAPKIHPGGNGVFSPTIVVDGRVVGSWKRTVKKRAVTVEFTPFRPFTAPEQDVIAEAAGRYGDFLGLPVVL